ncbi:uncharacterized protein LOC126918058 [Bombus affinis]|uniref:Uncharacterized protein LOC100649889 n=1 Tax=Bombus terrestris TaxID=30195 RepID=A0A9C6W2N2_BOMTE|nr:uncharacterized protein LOC100649889 [Bombus terrestris]XP_050581605.1 uncharacterized protein LOC126918058 [Bombus affinis]
MHKYQTLLDPIVVCPYDKSHSVAKSRLPKHIIKCEKQYPEHYKLMCPYNASHRLSKKEFEEHITTCPTRNILESEIYSEIRKHGATNFVPPDLSSTIDCKENWDIDINNNPITITEEEYSVGNNIDSKAHCDSPQYKLEKRSADDIFIRAPRGFSEAMLKEVTEDYCIEDLESVVSSMGIGRGKITLNTDQLKKIGLGRGTNEDSCIEDSESVVSSMGIGRGKITLNTDKLKKIGLGRGANEDSCIEDSESVVSSMGFGRGKITLNTDKLKKIGLGRGANGDSCVEDLESVVSSMGIGRGKITLNADQLKKIGLGRGRPMNNVS